MSRVAGCGLALALALALALTGCTGDDPSAPPALSTRTPGTLTACVAPGPGVAAETDAGLEGFDVAVLGDVADELALDLDVVTTSFDAVVSGVALNSGRCDVAAAAVVNDPTLDAVATRTVPYRTVHRLVVTLDSTGDVAPAQVAGSVGVETGGAASAAAGQLSSAEMVDVPSRVDLGRALAAGVVDHALVSVVDRPALEDQLDTPLALHAVVPTGDETVLLLPVDADEELLAAVDEALVAMRDAGRLEALVETWLRR